MFAENLVGLGLLLSVSYIKSIPTHEKVFAVGKSGPNATFDLICLGLGWPWVGEFVGFIISTGICFPTQHDLVNREHPNGFVLSFYHAVVVSCCRVSVKSCLCCIVLSFYHVVVLSCSCYGVIVLSSYRVIVLSCSKAERALDEAAAEDSKRYQLENAGDTQEAFLRHLKQVCACLY